MPVELPFLPPEIRLLTNTEIERLQQRFPSLPSSPKDCPTCRGRKTFRWWHYSVDGVRTVEDYLCPCSDQWMLNLYLLNANIGDVYQRLSWDDVAAEQGAIDKVLSYVGKADAYVEAGCGIILHGEHGSGKTLLSTLILKDLLAKGYDGYFTTFSEMIDTYTGGWYSPEEKDWFHRRIKNAEILVLDDVGKEYQGQKRSGLPESTFDEVLRHRISSGSPTIITTNFDMTRLKEGYGGGIMSLLHERSTTYEFTGQDFRNQARLRVDDEIEAGLRRPVTIS